MSGHSKWHTIKHKKGALDAKRGKIFTKLIKEITVAARTGGTGDLDSNARLRKAVSDAKGQNMPNDTIDRAIKRGTGELEGSQYEEITYEGYGLGGVAVMVETMTDNRNRTVAELRHLFSKNGGNLGEAGSVAWIFDKKGLFVIPKDAKSEDELLEIVLEAGADDLKSEGEVFEVLTAPENFEAVNEAIKAAGIDPQVAEVTMIPQNSIKLEGADAKSMLKLYDAIDDHDDVQKVYANFDIDESEMQ
jgi:YebC/PmpR family DNA-binding regulatory protein